MVSITLPRKKGADMVTELETTRKPIAAKEGQSYRNNNKQRNTDSLRPERHLWSLSMHLCCVYWKR